MQNGRSVFLCGFGSLRVVSMIMRLDRVTLNRERLPVDRDFRTLRDVLQKILKRLAALVTVFDFEPCNGLFGLLAFGGLFFGIFHGGL